MRQPNASGGVGGDGVDEGLEEGGAINDPRGQN